MSNTHEQNNTITNIGSTEGFAEGKSRNIDNSFVTDNRKARRKVPKQKEAKISRKSYAEAVRNITEEDVDFSRIYENLVKDEKSNSSQIEVISNCGSPKEKVSEFLDSHLKSIMQENWSYIKYSNDFIIKTKKLKDIPTYAILVTADVVGLYPSIPHEAGLKALKEALDKRENRNIATNGLIRMDEFVLKNNYLINGQVKQQISGTTIGTKFAPYTLMFLWMTLK